MRVKNHSDVIKGIYKHVQRYTVVTKLKNSQYNPHINMVSFKYDNSEFLQSHSVINYNHSLITFYRKKTNFFYRPIPFL